MEQESDESLIALTTHFAQVRSSQGHSTTVCGSNHCLTTGLRGDQPMADDTQLSTI